MLVLGLQFAVQTCLDVFSMNQPTPLLPRPILLSGGIVSLLGILQRCTLNHPDLDSFAFTVADEYRCEERFTKIEILQTGPGLPRQPQHGAALLLGVAAPVGQGAPQRRPHRRAAWPGPRSRRPG